jgi:hypothetical protein
MNLFNVRVYGIASMIALAGAAVCAENVGDRDRGSALILVRMEGSSIVEIHPENQGFEQCRNALIERLAETDDVMKIVPDNALIDKLQDQSFLRFMAAGREPIRLVVGAMEQSVIDILIPLEGRWSKDNTVFYRIAKFGEWQARRPSHNQLGSLSSCKRQLIPNSKPGR